MRDEPGIRLGKPSGPKQSSGAQPDGAPAYTRLGCSASTGAAGSILLDTTAAGTAVE